LKVGKRAESKDQGAKAELKAGKMRRAVVAADTVKKKKAAKPPSEVGIGSPALEYDLVRQNSRRMVCGPAETIMSVGCFRRLSFTNVNQKPGE
jgi:hypothetical protein